MQSPDQNVERNRQLLLDRSRAGLKKYGVTTERNDLTFSDWLQHLLEELLDAANYVQAAMNNAAPDSPAGYMHKGLLLWILYHHQGGKCPVGQPIRRVLGIEQHAALTTEQVLLADTVARMAGAPDNLMLECSPAASPAALEVLAERQRQVNAEGCAEATAQPVVCECGESYPPHSYGAGFIEGRGHCANCAAGAGEMASLLGVSPAPVVNQQLTPEPGPVAPLAPKHQGMRISAAGILRRVKGDLKFGAITLLDHLEQMAELFYSGDLTAVDAFLQLYNLDENRPEQQAPTDSGGAA